MAAGAGGNSGAGGAVRAGRAFVEIFAVDKVTPGIAQIIQSAGQIKAGLKLAGMGLGEGLLLASRQAGSVAAAIGSAVGRTAPSMGAAILSGIGTAAVGSVGVGRRIGIGLGRAVGAVMASETAAVLRSALGARLTSALNSTIVRAGLAAGTRLGAAIGAGMSRAGAFLADNQTTRSFREGWQDTAEAAFRYGRIVGERFGRGVAAASRAGNAVGRGGGLLGSFLRDNQLTRSISEGADDVARGFRRFVGPRLTRAIGNDLGTLGGFIGSRVSAAIGRGPAALSGAVALGRRLAVGIGSGITAAAPAIGRGLTAVLSGAGAWGRIGGKVTGGLLTAARGVAGMGIGLGRAGIGAVSGAIGATGRGISAAGGRMTGVGAGVLGAGGAVGGLAAMKLGDTISDLSKMDRAAKAFGISMEAASGLFGVLGANGGELKEDLEGLTQFAQKVQDAFAGVTGEPQKLFEGLSVSAKDIIDLPLDEKFFRLHAAIRELPQDMQMTKLSMLGGTDSMKKWLPLLSMSSDELRKQADGFRISTEEGDKATAAQKAIGQASAALEKVWQKIAIAVEPAVTQIAKSITAILEPMAQWVSQNQEAVVAIGAVVAAVTAVGAGLVLLGTSAMAIGAAMTGLGTIASTAFGVVGTVVSAVLSPIGLIAAALLAVGAVAVLLSEDATDAFADLYSGAEDTATGVKSFFVGAFESAKDTALTTWGGIVDAIKGGDLSLAMEVGVAGLKVVWANAMKWLMEKWIKFKGTVSDSWQKGTKSAADAHADSVGWVAEGIIGITRLWNTKEEADGLRKALAADAKDAAANRNADLKTKIAQAAQGRNKELDDLNKDVEEAQAKLAEATNKAAAARSKAEGLKALKENREAAAGLLGIAGLAGAGIDLAGIAPPPKNKPPNLPDPSKMGLGTSLGSFGGFGNVMQQFGGSSGILAKQLKVQEKIELGIRKLGGKAGGTLTEQSGDVFV